MNTKHKIAFFDELEKISTQKPSKYYAGLAAHELGHAKDYESGRIPQLRLAARVLSPTIGVIGGTALVHKGNPVLGGLAAFAGNVPTLADEMIASYHGMKALKQSGGFKEKELKQTRNQLLQMGGTYLGDAVKNTGAALALGGRGDLRVAGIGLALGGLSAREGLGIRAVQKAKHQSTISKGQVTRLRKSMKVGAQIYKKRLKKKGIGQGLGGYYVVKPANKIFRRLTKKQITGDLKKKDMEEILSKGGVVLPEAA